MSIISIASKASVSRGLEYYENKNVIFWSQVSENVYTGYVKGSLEEPYCVTINVEHPKKSTCNCPHAEGKVRVCKHKIALYFTIFSEEAERLLEEIRMTEIEEEEKYSSRLDEIEMYVDSLSEDELRTHLINALMEIEELYENEDRW